MKVVILDVDGTLMDTNYPHVEAWARAFEEVGYRSPRVEIHKQIGRGSDRLIPDFVEGEDAIERASNLHADHYAELQNYGHPLPGAKELIASLVERDYEVWFATSAQPEELEQHQKELESADKITGIVQSADVENSKPAPDIFELALEKSGGSAEETIAVGDSTWDVKSARDAGIQVVAVLSGGAFSAQELKDAGAAEVYEDCAALLEAGFPE